MTLAAEPRSTAARLGRRGVTSTREHVVQPGFEPAYASIERGPRDHGPVGPFGRYLLTVVGAGSVGALPSMLAGFAEVARAAPGLRLVAVAEDPVARVAVTDLAIRLGISMRVELHAPAGLEQSVRRYRHAAAYLDLADAETMGPGLRRAVAAGVPAVSAAAAPGAVESELGGVVVVSGGRSWAKAVSEVLFHPAQAEARAAAGRARVLTMSWSRSATRTGSLPRRMSARMSDRLGRARDRPF
jgi:glycosyltransferase involved in cell wall biosynthesis